MGRSEFGPNRKLVVLRRLPANPMSEDWLVVAEASGACSVLLSAAGPVVLFMSSSSSFSPGMQGYESPSVKSKVVPSSNFPPGLLISSCSYYSWAFGSVMQTIPASFAFEAVLLFRFVCYAPEADCWTPLSVLLLPTVSLALAAARSLVVRVSPANPNVKVFFYPLFAPPVYY